MGEKNQKGPYATGLAGSFASRPPWVVLPPPFSRSSVIELSASRAAVWRLSAVVASRVRSVQQRLALRAGANRHTPQCLQVVIRAKVLKAEAVRVVA